MATATKAKPKKNSDQAYGAEGRGNVLLFDPDKLKIVDDPNNPLYEDPDGLTPSETFVASVGFHGVLQSIVVRKNPETGETEVVAGRKRVLAARIVNKERKRRGEQPMTVPAIVRRGEDLSLMGVMATENEGRVEKSPMQRAKLMQAMHSRGASESELAIHFDCTLATVKNLLGLLEAPAVVRKAVDQGEITATAGYALSKLSAAEAKERLAEALTKAPKVKGRRNAKKMKEIITRTRAVRTKAVIEEMIVGIETRSQGMIEVYRDPAISVLRWVLGDDQALDKLIPDEEEEETDDDEIEVGDEIEGVGGPKETMYDHSPKAKTDEEE